MRAAARWLAIAIAVPLALVLAAFGLLQTRIGQDWLAAAVARAASSPGFSLTIEGLRGTVPLRMTATRIEVGRRQGYVAEFAQCSPRSRAGGAAQLARCMSGRSILPT